MSLKVLKTEQKIENEPYKIKKLDGLRMFLSGFNEIHHIGKNIIDHIVIALERGTTNENYFKHKLSTYKGEKKACVFFHGYMQTGASFERIESLLSSLPIDFFCFSSEYRPYSQFIEKSAEQAIKTIEFVLQNTDIEELYLIGHSQGGLIIRTIIQKLGYFQGVKRCIFLATPHMGTYAAVLGYLHYGLTRFVNFYPLLPKIEGESAIQMLPGSTFLKDLNRRPLPVNIHYISVYSYLDPVVWPPKFARMPYTEAQNILLMKIGHLHHLYSFQTLEIILNSLLIQWKEIKKTDGMLLVGDKLLFRRQLRSKDQHYSEMITYAD